MLLTAAVALVVLAALVSSASAITISPTGRITATSTNPAFTLSSNGAAVTCSTSSIVSNMATSGSGSVPVGGATFGGCANSTLGAVTITQSSAWTKIIDLVVLPGPNPPAGNYIRLRLIIPARGITFRSAVLGCSFTAAGQVGFLIGPVNLTSDIIIIILTISTSALTVDSSSGACALVAPVGLAITAGGSYTNSPSVTVHP